MNTRDGTIMDDEKAFKVVTGILSTCQKALKYCLTAEHTSSSIYNLQPEAASSKNRSIANLKLEFDSKVFLSKPPCCEQLRDSFIRDFANVSKKITSIYLTFLSTPELIMMCRVLHLSTFRPPVDNALWAHCRRRVFFIDSKKL